MAWNAHGVAGGKKKKQTRDRALAASERVKPADVLFTQVQTRRTAAGAAVGRPMIARREGWQTAAHNATCCGIVPRVNVAERRRSCARGAPAACWSCYLAANQLQWSRGLSAAGAAAAR